MFKEVFISHAKEDILYAEDLYDFLNENNYEPWLDKKKLRVGANWDFEIKNALKNSTFVIILLSSTSVNKRGYVQREFKYALEYSETKLHDDIYIIPILLDRCTVPDHLSKYQWIEIGDDDYRKKILESLNYQREKYIQSLPPDQVSLNDYTTFSIDLKSNVKNIDYNCSLPLFHKNNYFDANYINPFIQQRALDIIDVYRKNTEDEIIYFQNPENSGYLEINGTVEYITKDYLSISITYESYMGQAHPYTSIQTLNFRFNPETKIEFNEIVNYDNLQKFLIDSINRFGNEEQQEVLINYCEYITEENINFTFNEKNIEIIFINQLPRVIMALGFLSIPLNKIDNNV